MGVAMLKRLPSVFVCAFLLFSAFGSDRASAVTINPTPTGNTFNVSFGNVVVGSSLTISFNLTWANESGKDYAVGVIQFELYVSLGYPTNNF
jgi:hypothetical protein